MQHMLKPIFLNKNYTTTLRPNNYKECVIKQISMHMFIRGSLHFEAYQLVDLLFGCEHLKTTNELRETLHWVTPGISTTYNSSTHKAASKSIKITNTTRNLLLWRAGKLDETKQYTFHRHVNKCNASEYCTLYGRD